MAVMPNVDVLRSTLRIKTSKGIGTAFLVNFLDGLFMISAAHLIEGSARDDQFYISKDNEWKAHKFGEIGFCAMGYDIAAVRLPMKDNGYPEQLPEGCPEKLLTGTAIVGADYAYLGFPLGFEQSGMPSSFNGYSGPLLKAGVFAGVVEINGLRTMMLDSYGNSGFSGGPIIGYDPINSQNLRVFGFVAGGYSDAEAPVFKRNNSGHLVKDGERCIRQQSGFTRFTGAEKVRDIVSEMYRGDHKKTRCTPTNLRSLTNFL